MPKTVSQAAVAVQRFAEFQVWDSPRARRVEAGARRVRSHEVFCRPRETYCVVSGSASRSAARGPFTLAARRLPPVLLEAGDPAFKVHVLIDDVWF